MPAGLQSLDVSLFRCINSSLSNPLFDRLMPWMSNTPWLTCALIAICVWLIVCGGARGRICVLMLLLSVCLGNWLLIDTLKKVFVRPRPFIELSGVHLRIGMGDSFSMPSSHAANWFSAMTVLFIYFRRTIWIMLPLALAVCLSRVYNGVHYPSDVLVGASLGAAYSLAAIFGFDWLWRKIGPRWFPIWDARLPSLANPRFVEVPGADGAEWLRLGYVVIAVCLLARLAYIGSGKIELSEDEAYQWIWSKHLALSYYSKPPLIACAQFMGTHLWGDNEFGVRFFSPVIASVLSLLVLRFLAREAGPRLAVIVVLAVTVTPLTALGATVMTVDPLSVLFWTAAMIIGWRAVQPEGTTKQWLWVGLWLGLGFLSKYTNLAQCVCWAVFFALWQPARRHLRRQGPYLALLIVALSTLPVVIWNAQHHWITVTHVASDGQLGEAWHRTYVIEFLLTEAALLHPIFFLGVIWAAFAFWRNPTLSGRVRTRASEVREPIFPILPVAGTPGPGVRETFSSPLPAPSDGGDPRLPFPLTAQAGRGLGRGDPFLAIRSPLSLFFFSMGAPLFLGYFILSFHSRILGNWIAPTIIPLFCLAALYWWKQWESGLRILKPLLVLSLVFGAVVVAILHAPNLVDKIIHRKLPAKLDLLRRVRGWKELAKVCDDARAGNDTFVICEHYGFTSEITFYSPVAKRNVVSNPIVFFEATDQPQNQFYFWPSYTDRKGQDALFVRQVEPPALRPDWLSRWWHHDPNILITNNPPALPPPREIQRQFESFTDLGFKNIVADGNIVRRVQLIVCHHLR